MSFDIHFSTESVRLSNCFSNKPASDVFSVHSVKIFQYSPPQQDKHLGQYLFLKMQDVGNLLRANVQIIVLALLVPVEPLHVSPPASARPHSPVSASAGLMLGEVPDRRPWTGGVSSGLSAARPLLCAVCRRLRSKELACTALSRIKQVVRLSHNFIVHFGPTAGHGATQRQHAPPGKRAKNQPKWRRLAVGEGSTETQPARTGSMWNSDAHASWQTPRNTRVTSKNKRSETSL